MLFHVEPNSSLQPCRSSNLVGKLAGISKFLLSELPTRRPHEGMSQQANQVNGSGGLWIDSKTIVFAYDVGFDLYLGKVSWLFGFDMGLEGLKSMRAD